ncbi:TrkA family potassium uptake protein [candidate division WOR-3 bacterium]|nr:TrkA family potassium uptake protein [candidate division WOR-3 bacterium]TET76675.1 MAG: TrkA family potassium uptake protein [Candidatus Cloacimonadota bacterium]
MKQFAVIGLGSFGRKVAVTLSEKGAEVIAVDKDRSKVEDIKDKVVHAVALDSTSLDELKGIGITDVDTVIVALGEQQEAAILTTVLLKNLGVGEVIARAMNALYAQILKMVGADKVILIEEQMGEQLAKALVAPQIIENIPLSSGHLLVEIKPRKEFIGKKLKDLDLRGRYGVNVVAIQKKVEEINDEGEVVTRIKVDDLPGPDDKITEDETLLVVGSEEEIERLVKEE